MLAVIIIIRGTKLEVLRCLWVRPFHSSWKWNIRYLEAVFHSAPSFCTSRIWILPSTCKKETSKQLVHWCMYNVYVSFWAGKIVLTTLFYVAHFVFLTDPDRDSCCSKQERYQRSHPSPYLATHFQYFGHILKIFWKKVKFSFTVDWTVHEYEYESGSAGPGSGSGFGKQL